MKTEIFADQATVAREAARFIAAEAGAAVAARGRFLVAVSGGSAPLAMFRALADESMPWANVHIFQVDERVAPPGHPDRNFTHLDECLLKHAPVPADNVHAMPVEAPDLEAAARSYAQTIEKFAGSAPVLDVIHLGLGPDGHTASLVPGDPVLTVTDADVAITGVYQNRRRMTLTYPVLGRARRILWFVVGAEKAGMLRRVQSADPSIPAGRVHQDNATVFADKAASDAGT